MATTKSKAALIGLIGVGAAALMLRGMPMQEGVMLTGYADPLGVPTKCMGDTRNVIIGHRYSKAECNQSLIEAVIAHATPVIEAAPNLRHAPDSVLFAVLSVAYNTGTNSAITRQLERDAQAGELQGLCEHILINPWTGKRWYITGTDRNAHKKRAACEAAGMSATACAARYPARIILPGLVKRRDFEYGACVSDLHLPNAHVRAISAQAKRELGILLAGKQQAIDDLLGD